MNMLENIRERRSIRNFKDEKVSKEQIKKLIKAALWAPSGSNIYAWTIKATKGDIADRIKKFSPGLYGDPPVLLVLCVDKEKALEKGGEQGKKVLSLMDVAVAAQNICLQATGMELGSCIVRSFNQKAVSEILELKEKIVPELIVSIGVPKRIPEPPPKRKVEEAAEWIGWKDG